MTSSTATNANASNGSQVQAHAQAAAAQAAYYNQHQFHHGYQPHMMHPQQYPGSAGMVYGSSAQGPGQRQGYWNGQN